MPKRTVKRHDWSRIFLEWVESRKSLSGFFRGRGIEINNGLNVARKRKWREKRDAIDERAVNRAMKRIEKKRALQWEKHAIANDALLGFVFKRIKKGEAVVMKDNKPVLDSDGKPVTIGMDEDSIAKLAQALERIVKTKSFMQGGPTERTENKNLNVHANLVNVLEQFKNERGE